MAIVVIRWDKTGTVRAARKGGINIVASRRGARGEQGPSIDVSQLEIDVGSISVWEFTATVAVPGVTPQSIVQAFPLAIAPSDGRDLDEIFAENIRVFARPGDGDITFTLQPAVGRFSGRYVIGYYKVS